MMHRLRVAQGRGDLKFEFLKPLVVDAVRRKVRLIEDEIERVIRDEFYGVDVGDALRRLYPKNFRDVRGEEALVVNVKGKGLPDFDYIVSILSRRLGVSEDEIERVLRLHEDEVTDIFWDAVAVILESLSRELGYPVYQYGRSAGYWGIPVEKIEMVLDLSRDDIIRLREEFIKEKIDEITEHVMESEDPRAYLEKYEFEGYLADLASLWILDMIRGEIVDILDFVWFKDNLPRRFIQKVEETVRRWNNQELWADIYEDYVEEWLRESGQG
jgi:DNA-binding transcriptional MerR regulator